jgi:hypothetical protein
MPFLLQRYLARKVQILFKIEDKPRVFGSVSQNRVWLANRIWFQQPYIKFDDSNG